LELALEILLELDEILRQRHAIGLEFVQLAHDHEIDLEAILRAPLVLQLGKHETQLRLHILEGHGRSIIHFAPAVSSLQHSIRNDTRLRQFGGSLSGAQAASRARLMPWPV